MSRARKPARLWLRSADKDREPVWLILDGGKQFSTGCAQHDRAGAEKALAEHIGKQFLAEAPKRNRAAADVSIAEVLAHYLSLKKDTATRPRELAARAENLMSFWGNKTLDDITSGTCAEYVKKRGNQNGSRRELEDLRAACRQAIADNVTRQSVTVTLPPKAKGRVKHLDRSTLAKLIWAAYRKRGKFRGAPNKRKPTIHIARFALAAVYTGSRSSRIWQASFVKEAGRPYIDLDAGVFYRAWEGELVAANKRAPPIRLPDRLLAHMRRWHAKGARYVVEYNGKPADPKRAFRNLVDEVLGEGAEGIVRHTLRHTAATWVMQAATDKWEASGYLGMTLETLEKTYGHHHPDHQAGVGAAFTTGRAGRMK